MRIGEKGRVLSKGFPSVQGSRKLEGLSSNFHEGRSKMTVSVALKNALHLYLCPIHYVS